MDQWIHHLTKKKKKKNWWDWFPVWREKNHHPSLSNSQTQERIEREGHVSVSKTKMSRTSDLKPCGKLPGVTIGRVCEKCDGKCVVCESFVNQHTKVRICEECKAPNGIGKCVFCGSTGVTDAYYCSECCLLERDRDGCPTILNLGDSKKDYHFDSKAKRIRTWRGGTTNPRSLPLPGEERWHSLVPLTVRALFTRSELTRLPILWQAAHPALSRFFSSNQHYSIACRDYHSSFIHLE